MLRVKNLHKSFGGQAIFRGADWFVGPQDRVALVGANGTGKSTLLKIAAGQESPDEGTLEQPKDLRVGYLAQRGFVLTEETVRAEARRGFDEILSLQEELAGIEAELEAARQPAATLQRLAVRQAEIMERLAILGAQDVDRQVHVVLTGLGYREEEFDRPLSTFSGGWQMRAALARILLRRPQMLLLDEPTNHLDMEAREWLEGFLANYPYAFVVVSHDRYFLDVTVRRTTEIVGYQLEDYTGNYTAFERERAKRLALRRQAYDRQQQEIRRIQRFIDRFRAKNTKAVQVQSRIKMLERMERLPLPPPERRSIVVPQPACPRSGKIVLELRQVSKRYGAQVVLDHIDLRIVRGGRIALVGPNGAGKSTLMRILSGAEPPDDGHWMPGHNMQAAFFAQDHGERMDPSHSVLEAVSAIAPNDFVPQVRGLLGAFLFSGDEVDKRVSVLSGGERNRLALARLLVRPSNLLLLDEPTNHLDLAAKDVLLEALRRYEGTVVFVSHDRHFLASLADEVVEVGGGRVREFPGGYEDFLWKRRHEGRAQGGADAGAGAAKEAVLRGSDGAALHGGETVAGGAPDGAAGAAESSPPRRSPRTAARDRRRARRLAEVEEEITTLEDRKSRFNQVMSRPDFFSHPEKADLYVKQYQAVEEQLARLYVEWEELSD